MESFKSFPKQVPQLSEREILVVQDNVWLINTQIEL